MTQPLHHPADEDLVAYTAATAPEALAVLVACHLTFCGRCRATVADLEAVGAALAPLPTPAVDVPPVGALLARLEPHGRPAAAAARAPRSDGLPLPLRSRVGGLAELRWRRLPLGVAHAWLDLEGAQAFLVDFPAGMNLPEHRHEGIERAMPLVGGFSADGLAYGPGDVSVAEGEGVHQVRVDDDGRCLCLFVNDGDVIPESTALRVVGRLLGLS